MLKILCLMLSLALPGFVLADAAQNKKLVVEFYTKVLFEGKVELIDKYIGETYIQHNPNVANGKQAVIDMIKANAPKSGKVEPFGEIVRSIAEDDLVMLHIRSFKWPPSHGAAIVDIFRVKNGKIVEHWDVVQPVPETSANNNTMF